MNMNTLLTLIVILLVILVLVIYKLYVRIKAVDEFSHQVSRNVLQLENKVRELSETMSFFDDDLK